jgi:tetratricopeptide (TPR) repeat protein/DNA-binding XRE family transcriptional regulator
MRTFADLLTEYAARTGVSDAELARAVGVQRQTIFRWKEGLVARPRSPEDVQRLAAKLRLTPQERDELLLAAGFPPVAPSIGSPLLAAPAPQPGAAEAAAEEPAGPVHSNRGRGRSVPWFALGGALLAILLLAAGVWVWRRASYPRAQPGETLIIIGQFANYTGGAQGYNVAGRLREALERELAAGRLASVRAATWPGVIVDAQAAEAAALAAGAALAIWGEYDSGRVVAHLTVPGALAAAEPAPLEKQVRSPADLVTTINGELPEEVRFVALLTIGQMYANRKDFARARAVLLQASTRPPTAPSALASLQFLLGYSHQMGQPPDLDQAISAYSAALTAQSDLVAASNNRAIAYLRRGQPGDAGRAVADLDTVIAAMPDDSMAFLNRGAAYLQLGGLHSASRAVADLDRAIALAPDAAPAYFNRGLAYVRLNQSQRWQADLQRALALEPGHAGALSGLCWAYALDEAPADALPYCERAIALDPAGPARDSRGIVLAQLGRYQDAQADLEAYLAGLPAGTIPSGSDREARYRAWLAALAAGANPFDAATLAELRQE